MYNIKQMYTSYIEKTVFMSCVVTHYQIVIHPKDHTLIQITALAMSK